MKKLLLALSAFAFLAAVQAKADEPAKAADAGEKKPAKKAHKKGKKKMEKKDDAAAAPAK
jgi:Ni/Co efflux regulator RcnB